MYIVLNNVIDFPSCEGAAQTEATKVYVELNARDTLCDQNTNINQNFMHIAGLLVTNRSKIAYRVSYFGMSMLYSFWLAIQTDKGDKYALLQPSILYYSVNTIK